MAKEVTRAACSRRATEYIDLLGSMSSVHPSDLQIVSTWANEAREWKASYDPDKGTVWEVPHGEPEPF